MRVLIVQLGDMTKVYQATSENRRAVHNLEKAAKHLGFYVERTETELVECDAPTPKTPDALAD